MQTPDQIQPIFRFPWYGTLTPDQVRRELERGTYFVRLDCVISLLLVTFRHRSRVHMFRGSLAYGFHVYLYSFISMLLGWWSIPWGPLETVMSIWANLNGGWDSTAEIQAMLPELPGIELDSPVKCSM